MSEPTDLSAARYRVCWQGPRGEVQRSRETYTREGALAIAAARNAVRADDTVFWVEPVREDDDGHTRR